MRARICTALVLVLVVAACGDTETTAPSTGSTPTTQPPGRTIDLTNAQVNSCGDAYVYLSTDEAMLTIGVEGAVTRAGEEGGPIEETLAVGDGGVIVNLAIGTDLQQLACSDVIEREPVIERELAASAGMLAVTVTPNMDQPSQVGLVPSMMDVTITGLVFDGVTIVPAAIEVEDAFVGWLAG